MALYPMSPYWPTLVGVPHLDPTSAFKNKVEVTDRAQTQDDNLGEVTPVPKSFKGPVKPVVARPSMTHTILENVRRLGL